MADVLNALAHVMTGYNPDERLRQNVGALTQAISGIGQQDRMRAFGGEVLQRLEAGEDLDMKGLFSLSQKYKLSPEETQQTFKLLQDSQAIEKAMQVRKLGQKKVSDVLKPEETPALTPGATLSDLAAIQGPLSAILRQPTTAEKAEPLYKTKRGFLPRDQAVREMPYEEPPKEGGAEWGSAGAGVIFNKKTGAVKVDPDVAKSLKSQGGKETDYIQNVKFNMETLGMDKDSAAKLAMKMTGKSDEQIYQEFLKQASLSPAQGITPQDPKVMADKMFKAWKGVKDASEGKPTVPSWRDYQGE